MTGYVGYVILGVLFLGLGCIGLRVWLYRRRFDTYHILLVAHSDALFLYDTIRHFQCKPTHFHRGHKFKVTWVESLLDATTGRDAQRFCKLVPLNIASFDAVLLSEQSCGEGLSLSQVRDLAAATPGVVVWGLSHGGDPSFAQRCRLNTMRLDSAPRLLIYSGSLVADMAQRSFLADMERTEQEHGPVVAQAVAQ